MLEYGRIDVSKGFFVSKNDGSHGVSFAITGTFMRQILDFTLKYVIVVTI